MNAPARNPVPRKTAGGVNIIAVFHVVPIDDDMAAVLLVTRTHKRHAADALIIVKSAAQIVPRVAWSIYDRIIQQGVWDGQPTEEIRIFPLQYVE